MKKIVSLIGVGAMVMALGLGSAIAQQTTDPKATPVTPPAKEQPAPEKAKPGMEMKADAKANEVKPGTPAPAAPVAGKADEKATKVEAANDKAPAPTTAPAKPDVKADAGKTDVKKDSTAKAEGKTEEAKSVK
jgi:hypothetical protein